MALFPFVTSVSNTVIPRGVWVYILRKEGKQDQYQLEKSNFLNSCYSCLTHTLYLNKVFAWSKIWQFSKMTFSTISWIFARKFYFIVAWSGFIFIRFCLTTPEHSSEQHTEDWSEFDIKQMKRMISPKIKHSIFKKWWDAFVQNVNARSLAITAELFILETQNPKPRGFSQDLPGVKYFHHLVGAVRQTVICFYF